jgi:VWA domain-containing protein
MAVNATMVETAPPSESLNADRGTELGKPTRVLTATLRLVLTLVRVWARIAGSVVGSLSRGAAVLGGGAARGSHSLLLPFRAIAEPLAVAALREVRATGRLLGGCLLRTFGVLLRPLRFVALVTVAVRRSLARVVGRVLQALAAGAARYGSWVAWRLARGGRACGHAIDVAAGLVAGALRPIVLVSARVVRRGASSIVAIAGDVLLVPIGRASRAVLAPVLAATRRVLSWVGSAAGPEAAARRWLRRPVGRIAVVVLLTTLLTASPRPTRGVIGLLWFAGVGYALLPVGCRLRLITSDQLAPRLELVRRRAAHSVRVATAKAVLDTNRPSRAAVAPLDSAVVASSVARGPPFDLAVYQNEYVPRNGTEVDAIITVTATSAEGRESRGPSPDRAEVILIDCSGSMAYPMAKLQGAKAATAAAIDSLRDGTWFAVVRATHIAEPAYPPSGLARASSRTRSEAKRALNLLWPEGGTAMGQWLLLARELLSTRPAAIAHAILLTDGRNESEPPGALDSALAACSGLFQCDCRGVGTDWEVGQLRKIASSLLGTVDIVAEPAGLEADFRLMTHATMAKLTGGVALRLWTPKGARVRSLKQVSPTIVDITSQRRPVDGRTADYPTGAWGGGVARLPPVSSRAGQRNRCGDARRARWPRRR